MAKHINKINNKYTMEEGPRAVPPKYSPDDKYSELRRKVKRTELEKKGLL